MLDRKIFRLYSDDEHKVVLNTSEEEKFDPENPLPYCPSSKIKPDNETRNIVKSYKFQKLFSINDFQKMKQEELEFKVFINEE